MIEERRYFKDVRTNGLSYPVKIGSKLKYQDNFTIADIDIKAKIESKYAGNFQKEILKIIGDKETYAGLNELSSLLLKHINSLNALTASITFSYPYFILKKRNGTDDISLTKCLCSYILKKESLIKYAKKFSIEIPILIPHYVIPGYTREVAEVSAKIIIEIEGFDSFFIEDLIEVVERNINNVVFDYGASLTREIEEELRNKYFIDKCMVKIINQEIKTSRTEKETKPLLNEKHFDYEGEHLFI